jgi:hypothetical protein
MRRLVLIIGVAGASVLGSAFPASAESSNRRTASGTILSPLARSGPGMLGYFVRGAVQTANPPTTSVGRTGIPFLKDNCPFQPG